MLYNGQEVIIKTDVPKYGIIIGEMYSYIHSTNLILIKTQQPTKHHTKQLEMNHVVFGCIKKQVKGYMEYVPTIKSKEIKELLSSCLCCSKESASASGLCSKCGKQVTGFRDKLGSVVSA